MAKQSKRYRKALEAVEATKVYSLTEAVAQIKAGATSKFDETIEVAFNLGVDPRHSDQQVRGMVALPHGQGKDVRVAVFARGDKAEAAKKAGADVVGAEDLMESMQKGDLNYDRVIASPDMMAVVGRIGKILGPKGLMPNPKLGTVTPDVAAAVEKAKAGEVEVRVEKAGIVHAGVGKASFKPEQIAENIKAVGEALEKAKPSGAKGQYFKKLSVSSTMGPGIQVDVASLKEVA